jgi:hypothetical protein
MKPVFVRTRSTSERFFIAHNTEFILPDVLQSLNVLTRVSNQIHKHRIKKSLMVSL